MAFFGGPPKDVLLQTARGIAVTAMQVQMVAASEGEAKKHAIENLKAQGIPINVFDLALLVAEVVSEQNMGWVKKNQFVGMIHGSLLAMGMPPDDASNMKGVIEQAIQTRSRVEKGFRKIHGE